MKSNFFGFNAKMALAALAVCGTFASCYEKEEIDVTPTPTLPDPVYVIYGNVTNATTGEAVPNVSVAITSSNGSSANVTTDDNGFFIKEDITAGTHTVSIDADGFLKATRTVYLQTVDKGETCIAVVDMKLYDASSQVITPEVNVPASSEQASEMLEAAKEEMTGLLGSVSGLDQSSLEMSVDENGNTIVAASCDATGAVGEAVSVQVPCFTGFASTITPLTTKALTDGQIWLASAENVLNMSYGLKLVNSTVTLPGLSGQSIIGYKLNIIMANRLMQFNGMEGLVTYQESVTASPVYESHDSHDSHDGHGTNPGAGGGSSANAN